LHFNHWV